jgi:uncharacterized membrane protein
MEFLGLILSGSIILVVLIIVRSILLRDRIRNLERQIVYLKSVAERVAQIEIEMEKLQSLEKRTGQDESGASKSTGAFTIPVSVPSKQLVSESLKTKPIQPPRKIETSKSRTREEWESFVGGKLLNRIGALALILGLGFFMKYAFDNNWISETVRVLIGAAAGFLCIAFAYRTNRKGFQIFAQGLVGSGIAILYLSVFASFNYYALLPQWIAFILMACVTAFSLFLGIYFNSLAIGVLGWAGGFLTPLMLSTGSSNEIGLFTYIALLNVGLLAIVFTKKDWHILEPLTFAGTWLIYFIWYFEFYHESDFMVTIFFISLFWFLFFGLDIVRLKVLHTPGNSLQHSVAILNSALYYIMLYGLVNKNYHSWMGGVTIILGGIYFTVFYILKHSNFVDEHTSMRYTLSSIVLAIVATSIQFEDFTTILFWSLEAVLLLWCGVHWKKQFIYRTATGLFIIAVWKFITTDGALVYNPLEQFTFIFNQRCLTLFVFLITFGASSWFMRNNNSDENLSFFFHTAWCATLFVLVTIEMNDLFRWKMTIQSWNDLEQLRFLRIVTLAGVWALLSLPIVWYGLLKKIVPVHIPGLIILALSTLFISVRGLSFEPLAKFQLLLNVRTATLLFVLTALFIHQWMIASREKTFPWLYLVRGGIQIGIVILTLILFTGETIDYFQYLILTTQAQGLELWHLNNLKQLSLSTVWLFFSAALMAIGFWRSLRSLRIIAFVLFGFTILKIFIYDLSYLETLYRIFSFIGLGLILIAVSYAYQRYKNIIFGTTENEASLNTNPS